MDNTHHMALTREDTSEDGNDQQTELDSPDVAELTRKWGPDVLASATTGFLLLALYIRTLYPSIVGGDAGELIIASHEFGVAHPPGYPVFTIMTKLMMTFLPIGNLAYRANVLVAIFSSVAGALLQLTVLSFFTVASFSLSDLVWRWSVAAEVFSLNNMMICLLLLLSVAFDQADAKTLPKVAQWGAFASGLTLCNQHTSVFYVGIIALWVLTSLWRAGHHSFTTYRQLGLAFLAGLLPYIYLPISAWYQQARWTWGDQRTIQGFFTHLFRMEYGTFSLALRNTTSDVVLGMSAYVNHMLSANGTWILGPGLALFSIVCVFRRQFLRGNQAPVIFFIMMLSYQLFFAWRTNLDVTVPLNYAVVERFWMQTDIIVCLLSGVGLHKVLSFICSRISDVQYLSSKSVLAVVSALVLAVMQLTKNFALCDQSNNYVVRDYGVTLLNIMPKHALILTRGDLTHNIMRYLHLCENMRPDLVLMDQEIITAKWFIPMLNHTYPDITFPGDFLGTVKGRFRDGKVSYSMKNLLDLNINNFSGVFMCQNMKQSHISWKVSYLKLPYGPCIKMVPSKFSFNPLKYSKEAGDVADDWHYSFNRISLANYLCKEAELNKNETQKKSLYIAAFHIYQDKIKKNLSRDIPAQWHRSFGLTCLQLFNMEQSTKKNELKKLSIHHLKLYVHLEPDNHNVPQIIQYIKELETPLFSKDGHP